MLEGFRGRHTELISLYIPSGYNLQEIMNMLKQEYALTQNVKSRTTRHNVLSALEKVMNHLRLFKKTPPNGLVIFCGNVSPTEGEPYIKLWSVEPPQPLAQKIYWCDQNFVLDPLKEMVREREIYGLITIDTGGSDIGFLKGKKVILEKHIDSLVPGKTSKGGWCLSSDSILKMHDYFAKLEEIEKKNNPILSYDFNNNTIVDTNIGGFKKRIPQRAYKITTEHPVFEIKTTPEHRFFVFKENRITTKSAEDIRIGDKLLAVSRIEYRGKSKALKLKIPCRYEVTKEGIEFLIKTRKVRGLRQKDVAKTLKVSQTMISKFELMERNLGLKKLRQLLRLYDLNEREFLKKFIKRKQLIRFPNRINSRLCQILGYILGDGTEDTNRIILYDEDVNLLKKYNQMIKDEFSVNTSLKRRKNKNYYELRIYSLYLLKIIKKFFPEVLCSTRERSIPKVIHSLPKSQLGSFLRGLFDAEGYIYIRNNSIGITTSSENLMRTLQMLLLRFGIVSSFSSRIFGFSKKEKFGLVITDKNSLLNFARHIGFESTHKKLGLDKILEKLRFSEFLSHSTMVPVNGKEIFRLAKKLGLTQRDFLDLNNFFAGRRDICCTSFKMKVLPVLENKIDELKSKSEDVKEIEREIKKIKEMIKSGLIQVKVKKKESIKPTGFYYDISVPKYQNFIVNGMIVHNSQQRYQRIREEAKHEHLKKTGEIANQIFKQEKDLKGILIGGPGFVKNEFYEGDYLDYQLRQKIIGLVDTGETGMQGLQEMIQRGESLIQQASITKERHTMEEFFQHLKKDDGLVVYGLEEVENALDYGAVKILLVSEGFNWVRAKLTCSCGYSIEKNVDPERIEKCPKCGKEMKIEEEKDLIEILSERAKNLGSEVRIISVDSREGEQFKEIGGIGAILRYKIV